MIRIVGTVALCAVTLSSCFGESQSEDVQKFERSELHALGSSCGGDFFAVRDGNFVWVRGSETQIAQKDVKIADLGSHQLAMTATFKAGSIVTTFALNDAGNIAKIVDITFNTDLPPEAWAKAGISRDQFYARLKDFKNVPTMVLCPPAAT
ncbi:hypothetical protein [Rhizobium sp. BR 362]|uniref:hypothetical protein n=1 Tax=Rhizobium sp. BR 362 TaxID=3040670 RepID=UPI002F4128E3